MRVATIPIEDLGAYLFDADRALLAAEAGAWLSASRQFRAFAETYRAKIRKKARASRDEESQRDLAFELAVAVRLVGERRFSVEYEPYGVTERAPDLRVTFRGGLRFNIEAKRVRPRASTLGATRAAALARTVSTKLGQLRPAMVNVLALGGDDLSPELVSAAMDCLEDRAADRNEAFFGELGFRGTRDFLRQYQRLSGTLAFDGGASRLLVNQRATHPLPADLARILGRL